MSNKKTNSQFQGLIFAYELTPQDIKLRFLRLIPLSRIKLKDVKYMRLSARRECLDFGLNFIWPSFLRNDRGQNPVYVITTRRGGKKFFLRMGGSFHYKVRSAIGQHQKRG
ncbi:hypothetical protein ACFLQY_03385 [Verrucomicrobiota bacterium]